MSYSQNGRFNQSGVFDNDDDDIEGDLEFNLLKKLAALVQRKSELTTALTKII